MTRSAALVIMYAINSELLTSVLKVLWLIAFNIRYVIVCGTVCHWFPDIYRSAASEKWPEILSDTQENIAPFSEDHKIESMILNVGTEVGLLI